MYGCEIVWPVADRQRRILVRELGERLGSERLARDASKRVEDLELRDPALDELRLHHPISLGFDVGHDRDVWRCEMQANAMGARKISGLGPSP